MTPGVSVVLPLYNGARWIAGALDCLKAQTFEGFEAVIVDDGSSDDSAEKVRPYLADERFRFVRRAHAGIPVTRNHALSLCRGDFIAFLDQDDRYRSDKLRAQVEALRSHPGAGACSTGVERIDGEGRSLGLRALPWRPDGRLFDAFLSEGFAVPLLSVMARRSLLERIGPFDESLFGTDDFDWLLRAAGAAPFCRVEAPLSLQRFQPGTAGQSEPMYRDKFVLAAKMRGLWPERSAQIDRFEAGARYLYGSFLLAADRGGEARPQLAAAWRLKKSDWRAAVKWALSWRHG